MKNIKIIILLFLVLFCNKTFSQISFYSPDDVKYKYVSCVDEMNQDEIKTYNSFIKNGLSDTLSLELINAGRTYDNLLDAPPTIIDINLYYFTDSINNIKDKQIIDLFLINSTIKTIKSITLKFTVFDKYDNQIFDTKTGNQYLIVKFYNLSGRVNSDKYVDELKNEFSSLHILDAVKDADYVQPFYNKNAKSIRLIDSKIIYTDGTSTSKISLWDVEEYDSRNLIKDGPLSPSNEFNKRFYSDQQ